MNTFKIPKGCKTKTALFGGREWTLISVPWPYRAVGPLGRNDSAVIDDELNVILFRHVNDDSDKILILHELAHYCFPTLDEPDLVRGDGALKEALEQLGVNLDAMLEGYE